jgi:hypothetical protein
MKTLSLLLVLLLGAAVIVPDCMYDDGDCMVAATYYPDDNRTVWSSACNDGYTGGGITGGNLIPAICGA